MSIILKLRLYGSIVLCSFKEILKAFGSSGRDIGVILKNISCIRSIYLSVLIYVRSLLLDFGNSVAAAC